MAWCRQATSHYLCQCWPRSMSPNDVTRPQCKWVLFLQNEFHVPVLGSLFFSIARVLWDAFFPISLLVYWILKKTSPKFIFKNAHFTSPRGPSQYKDGVLPVEGSHVSRPSYLQHGNPHTWEWQSLYWGGTQAVSGYGIYYWILL